MTFYAMNDAKSIEGAYRALAGDVVEAEKAFNPLDLETEPWT